MPQAPILEQILHSKRDEVARCQKVCPLRALQDQIASAAPARDLRAALFAPGVSLIAEVKRASPSKGLLCPQADFDPAALARVYQASGAAAISVLTDERFFQGSLEHLRLVRKSVALPVLRKDFILDPYQVYEARAAGADALLLIVAALDDAMLESFYHLTRELGMDALIEVHDGAEMERALRMEPRIIGINNRNLGTFQVDLETTARLMPLVPEGIAVVAESGVHHRADVRRMAEIGVDAVLVGEALVTAVDVGQKVRELAYAGQTG
jgi:indole-3-glycerol phosphate synthase